MQITKRPIDEELSDDDFVCLSDDDYSDFENENSFVKVDDDEEGIQKNGQTIQINLMEDFQKENQISEKIEEIESEIKENTNKAEENTNKVEENNEKETLYQQSVEISISDDTNHSIVVKVIENPQYARSTNTNSIYACSSSGAFSSCGPAQAHVRSSMNRNSALNYVVSYKSQSNPVESYYGRPYSTVSKTSYVTSLNDSSPSNTSASQLGTYPYCCAY